MKKKIFITIGIISGLLILFFSSVKIYGLYVDRTLTYHNTDLTSYFSGPVLSGLSYVPETEPPEINALSAIVIDECTGKILYEKEPDRPIPPASITKIAAMYTAMEELKKQGISLDQSYEIPEEAWAVNLDRRASKVYMGEGQRITIRQLLQAMACPSGNDAAIALAIILAGSENNFCRLMNKHMKELNLSDTFFCDTSGLSSGNISTARDLAILSKTYINKYPENLKEFHSLKEFKYPVARNLYPYPDSDKEIPGVTQSFSCTNTLLKTLSGCDGLKTGYIDESGYNLSLTCERNGSRFISVTLGGSGNTTLEGTRNRAKDGTEIMEWAFTNFRTLQAEPANPYPVKLWGAPLKYGTRVLLSEKYKPQLTVPAEASEIQREIELPEFIQAPVKAGTEVGMVIYRSEDNILGEIPLTVKEDIPQGSWLKRFIDYMAK